MSLCCDIAFVYRGRYRREEAITALCHLWNGTCPFVYICTVAGYYCIQVGSSERENVYIREVSQANLSTLVFFVLDVNFSIFYCCGSSCGKIDDTRLYSIIHLLRCFNLIARDIYLGTRASGKSDNRNVPLSICVCVCIFSFRFIILFHFPIGKIYISKKHTYAENCAHFFYINTCTCTYTREEWPESSEKSIFKLFFSM